MTLFWVKRCGPALYAFADEVCSAPTYAVFNVLWT